MNDMLELKRHRSNWADPDIAAEIETLHFQSLTIWESVRQWAALQRSFEPQLQATAELFAAERQAALGELQARLKRVAEWQAQNGQSISINPIDPIHPT
jgi:hypothetical protein